MNRTSRRLYRMLYGGLIVIGVVLLIAWAFSLSAYGYEVDERGLAAEVRVQDVALFAGGVASLIAATSVFVIQHRRSRRPTV